MFIDKSRMLDKAGTRSRPGLFVLLHGSYAAPNTSFHTSGSVQVLRQRSCQREMNRYPKSKKRALINAVSLPMVVLDSVAVDDVAVVTAPCHTFHRRFRSTCHRGGEDTYDRPGIGEHHAVHHPAYDLVNSIQ